MMLLLLLCYCFSGRRQALVAQSGGRSEERAVGVQGEEDNGYEESGGVGFTRGIDS